MLFVCNVYGLFSLFFMQVILATSISYGAKLHSKYDLLTIETIGGIPPGKW